MFSSFLVLLCSVSFTSVPLSLFLVLWLFLFRTILFVSLLFKLLFRSVVFCSILSDLIMFYSAQLCLNHFLFSSVYSYLCYFVLNLGSFIFSCASFLPGSVLCCFARLCLDLFCSFQIPGGRNGGRGLLGDLISLDSGGAVALSTCCRCTWTSARRRVVKTGELLLGALVLQAQIKRAGPNCGGFSTRTRASVFTHPRYQSRTSLLA